MTNVITAICTAYCACRTCCGPNATGLTAAGTRPMPGRTVALPRAYPLGSRVVIGSHEYRGEDRTARRFDGRIDIYFPTHAEARRFGVQTNTVTIITPCSSPSKAKQ